MGNESKREKKRGGDLNNKLRLIQVEDADSSGETWSGAFKFCTIPLGRYLVLEVNPYYKVSTNHGAIHGRYTTLCRKAGSIGRELCGGGYLMRMAGVTG